MKLLELKSVFKKYGDQHVLNGISISFENGKIYLIKGRSGCGKSTLLNICSLLENPDRGEVFFKGTETKKLSEIERKEILRGHIGYIFQDYNLFEELSVYQNLQIYLLSITRKSIAEMDKKIKEQLEALHLTHKTKDKAKFLSGGERQRLTLARTLLLPRDLIFADEPSANIDEKNTCIMKEIFLRLKMAGTTIIIVTHDRVFDEIADVIFELDEGILK